MLRTAFPLFFLRRLPWSSFDFPRWQAWSTFLLTTVLWEFAPSMNLGWTYLATMPAHLMGLSLSASLLTMLVYLAAVLGFLRWWMQRGERWNGQGSMLNLIVASWLVISVVDAGVAAAGLPMALNWLLWLYSGWIVANALYGAVPKASLAYCLGGVVAISVLGLVLQVFAMRVSVFALTALSVAFF